MRGNAMEEQVTATQIADWLIWFAHEHGDGITNLKLQKQLYYAQAWRLALADRPLFDAQFQAWIHGPVISWLYGNYKKFGSGPIPFPAQPGVPEPDCLPEPSLPGEVRAHMMDVMGAYGDLSAWQLERLTHSEAPWIEARGGLPPDAPCQNVISEARMQQFYKELDRAASDQEAQRPGE